MAVNVFALSFYFNPLTPKPHRVLVTLIVISVINSMACKVYREIKFGRIMETTMTSANARTFGTSIPFQVAHRSQGDVFVNMNVTTVHDDVESNATRSGSAKTELTGTHFTEVTGSREDRV